MWRYAFAFCAAAGLGGCATMSQDECLSADWESVGYEDGSNGEEASRIGKHRKACSEYGVTPDLISYKLGRERGLELYCTPHKGFTEGRSGDKYHGVCPAHLEAAFVDAYTHGRRIHGLEDDIGDAERRISSIHARIASIEENIADFEADLVAGVSEKSTRSRIISKIRDLSEKKGDLERELEDLERQLDYDRRELDDLELMTY